MNYDYSDCKTVAEIIAKQIAEPDDPFVDTRDNARANVEDPFDFYNRYTMYITPNISQKKRNGRNKCRINRI